MKKLLFISLIAVVVMESCSSRIQEIPENIDNERQITASLGFATKSAISDADGFEMDFVRMDKATTTSSYSFTSVGTGSRASSTQNGKITFTGQYYNKNNYYSYFRCFNKLSSTKDEKAKTFTWTLDGKSDLLVSDVWNAGKYTTPSQSEVLFKHLLSKIEVRCQAKSLGILSAVQLLWGSITSMTVSTNQKVVYNYESDKFSYTTPIELPLFDGLSDNPIKNIAILDFESNSVTASAMLPPNTNEIVTLSIKTSIKLPTATIINVKIPGGLVAGKIHTIIINFPNNSILQTKSFSDNDFTYTCSNKEW